MKSKVLALFSLSILVLNLAGSSMADTRTVKAKGQINDLVALLPASDGVATLDVKRFFNDALPKILASNQPLLSSIMAHLSEMESKTGIDLRKFESVAVGLAMKQISAKDLDFDPVVIARGDISAGALIAVAKLASNGTYREEKMGERTVYVFKEKDVAKKNAPQVNNSAINGAVDRTIDGLTHEIAVASIDKGTLVMGSLERVRQTLAHDTTVAADLIGLLTVKETSITAFAMRTPNGTSKLLPLDNDEIGVNVDAIRYVAGSMDVSAAGASVSMMARTETADQAKNLSDTLDGLKFIGKAFLGNSKRADQRVYARLIENAKIGLRGNDVTLDLLVPQADMDLLIGSIKIK